MQIDLKNPQFVSYENNYKIESEISVYNRTDNIAQLVFTLVDIGESQAKRCTVYIKGKRVVFPSTSNSGSLTSFFFYNSISINLNKNNEFIIIRERDKNLATTIYIDTKRTIKEKFYIAYSYMPETMSLTKAERKICTVDLDYPHLEKYFGVYNRHGVALFGFDACNREYVFYWASPREKKVKKIECSICDFFSHTSSLAQSKDHTVHLEVKYNDQFFHKKITYFLNGEEAMTFFHCF